MNEMTTHAMLDRRRLITGGALAAGLLGVAAVEVTLAPAAHAVGASFNAITPYRTFDSRKLLNSKLAYDEYVDIDVWTDIEGTAQIPQASLAVTFNLTVTQTESNGYMLVWPAGVVPPLVSTINWGVATLANGGSVALGTSTSTGQGSLSFGVSGSSAVKTHFIVDITGYYA
jgi:hypothetical protein